MVGTHRNRDLVPLFDLQKGFHHLVHIRVALQMVRLDEVSVGIAPCVAQMHEADPIAELTHHGGKIVVRTHAERSRTETQTVRRAGHLGDEPPEIGGRREYPRKSQNRERRVVGMNGQHDPRLVGCRSDLPEEKDQMPPQLLRVDVAVTVQRLLELPQGETLLRTGKSGDHVAHQPVLFGCRHPFEPPASACLRLVVVFNPGSGTLQNEEIECDIGVALETQGPGTVGHGKGEVGAGPVEHRHEIVSHATDTAGGQVAQSLFVVLRIATEIARTSLDLLMDGNALHDAPHESCFGDEPFATPDLPDRPHLAVGYVVQRMHDVGGARLTDIPQTDRIIGPVPAPGLFAQIHVRSF